MSERVQFVITAQEWDPTFEEVSSGSGWGQKWGTPAHFSSCLCPVILYPM